MSTEADQAIASTASTARPLTDVNAQDERREFSPEVDFGVWWRNEGESQTWRVSWVRDTGEVYAVTAGRPEEVLAVLADSAGRPHPREHVDWLLDGWGERCGDPGSLDWVRDRVGAHRAKDHAPARDGRELPAPDDLELGLG
ncbi:MAG TPA: hypothetical protein VG275_11135 [Solirubrobacteraceae bacterium]|jgi:hypothetical protein|nr:hypothetical protein [Solirubrobacteraceae bacterium]